MLRTIFNYSRKLFPVSLENSTRLTYFAEERSASYFKTYHKSLHLITVNACRINNSIDITDKTNTKEECFCDSTKLKNESNSDNFVINEEYGVTFPKKNVLLPPSNAEEVDFIAPQMKPTYNIAAYADKSETLKHFIHLGVEIAKWEKHKDICFHILRMNFEQDIKPYIFLLNDLGIPVDELGRWLSVNPFVFEESLENIEARVNYLKSKKFDGQHVIDILIRTPKWINYSVTEIDKELGIYQDKFKLTNAEVRHVATRDPKLILYTLDSKFNLERMVVHIKQRMGFTPEEQKKLLLGFPRIYRTNLASLSKRFNIVHTEMELSHHTITKFPKVLGTREHRLSERHQFLKFIGRHQYDPLKPNYISPDTFIRGTDAEFAVDVAVSSPDIFNDFMKTL